MSVLSLVLLAGLVSGFGDGRVNRISPDTVTPTPDAVTEQTPRLTVRPGTMATGTHTAQAGLTSLDGFPEYLLYVPRQCVGTIRVPLVVLFHGGGRSSAQEMTKFQSLADRYGMIVLAPNARTPGKWDVFRGMYTTRRAKYVVQDGQVMVSAFPNEDVRRIDSAMIQVLRTHAIDPARIALLGFSNGGSYSLLLGRSNLDVFSRVVALSALTPFTGKGPTNPNTQFFLSGGMGEENMVRQTLTLASILRQQGQPVMTQIGLRGHVDYVEDEAFIWEWLRNSWTDSAITTRVPTYTDTDLLLTETMLKQVTDFWTRFQREPDSIRNGLRMKYQIQIPLIVGAERTTIVMTDLPALAAAAPAVSAILKVVGVTAEQAMAYRVAMIRTRIAQLAGMTIRESLSDSATMSGEPLARVVSTSALGKNLIFWKEHASLFNILERTGMWETQ